MHLEAQRLVAHAARDLDAAREMLEQEDFEHVCSFCRNALEKLLRAAILRRSPGTSSKSHNLVPLAALAGLSVPKREFMDLFDQLSRFGGTPAPEDLPVEPFAVPDREGATRILKQSVDCYRWLSEVIG